MIDEFPTTHRKSIDILPQFSSSYMYEQAFSNVTSIKITDINRLLSIENEIRVCLSKVRPRVAKDRHWINIREAYFTLSNGFQSNIFLFY